MAEKVKILAIDGGGTRGIVPLKILKYIEEHTQLKIFELFDLIAGTSTGSLVAAGLTCPDENQNVKHSIDDLIELYRNESKKIFPHRNYVDKLKSIRRPLYSSLGLDNILYKYFGNTKISDCLTPLLVCSYDIVHNRPLIFRTRYTNLGSFEYKELANASLKNICLASTAAPYYFKPHEFIYTDESGTNPLRVKCIDGGTYLNNPAIEAFTEILKHSSDPIYNKPKAKSTDIYILSIGTGEYINTTENIRNFQKGASKLILPLLSQMMSGTSYINDQLIRRLSLKQNYLRLNITIDEPEFGKLDGTETQFFDKLESYVEDQILNNKPRIQQIKEFIDQMNS